MISGVFGLVGSGKSLFLGMIAERAVQGKNINFHGLQLGTQKKYDYVYTNFKCDGCYKLEYDKLGIYDFRNSLIIVDEIMLLSDSRDYKSFSQNLKFFFSQHRKGGNDFIYASQAYKDVDLKIRQRTAQYYYVEQSFFKFSRVRRIDFYFNVEYGDIKDGLEFAPPATDFFFWRPKYYHNINSCEFINGSLHQEPDLIPWETK